MKLFKIVLAQCSQATEDKLEARDDWETINSKHDLVELLEAIKSLLQNQLQNDFYAGITTYQSLR